MWSARIAWAVAVEKAAERLTNVSTAIHDVKVDAICVLTNDAHSLASLVDSKVPGTTRFSPTSYT